MGVPPQEGSAEGPAGDGRDWYPGWVAMLGMPVWVTNPDGHICYVNPRAEALIGATEAEAIGHPCHEVIGGHTAEGAAFCGPNCPVRFLVSHGREVAPYSLRLDGRDGNRHDVRVVVIAAHHMAHDRPHLVHCIVDESRESRVRRYLDQIASRTRDSGPADLEHFHLTDREKEILELLVEDKSLREIADELFVSYATVRNHVQHILNKLGVHSILEAVAFYLLSED